nr:MAG TPA_asm: hypothetical protein [Caudoviricetes sp.]
MLGRMALTHLVIRSCISPLKWWCDFYCVTQ